jgi:hypothetical protein
LRQLLIVDDALAAKRVLPDQFLVGLKSAHLGDTIEVFAHNLACFKFVYDAAKVESLFSLSLLFVIEV